MSLTRPIVLVGLMGAGKTLVGKRLARRLNVPFVDSDEVIEHEEGRPVSEIFSVEGEPYFRAKERHVIATIVNAGTPLVLSTGGGAFMNAETRALIQQHATSVWLKADLDVLLERVSRRNTRPLLEQGDKCAILSDLMEQRYPIYAQAHITAENNRAPLSVVLRKVVDQILSS